MVSAAQVKELRDKTGAGMMDCKAALVDSQGDMEKAVERLREKGLAAAAKKAGRTTSEGTVDAYIHAGGKIGVLVEVNCETDFVAKNQQFLQLAHDIALQIAAANPSYVSRADVPAELVEKEKELLSKQALQEGKPENVVARIVEGRIEKFFSENCLLEQAYIREPERTVQELMAEHVAALGENINVRRFTRFLVGEEE